MKINDYIKAKEDELSNMWDSENQYKIMGHIHAILDDLEMAKIYWRRRLDEGGVANTRLDRFDDYSDFVQEIDVSDDDLAF